MYVCKTCKSNSIKTRVNKPFGKKDRKSIITPVYCRSCGSIDFEKEDPRKRFRRRRSRKK